MVAQGNTKPGVRRSGLWSKLLILFSEQCAVSLLECSPLGLGHVVPVDGHRQQRLAFDLRQMAVCDNLMDNCGSFCKTDIDMILPIDERNF